MFLPFFSLALTHHKQLMMRATASPTADTAGGLIKSPNYAALIAIVFP
ncbi:hypothetical protein PLIP_a2420 [Pseudoalteromonas lipolytica LMEB 39]|nr:hypothetical protein [Pseudoalteromonas lipolytica LMEB 39]